MSHAHKMREEKDCLNCGTIVQGKYCHVCGQPNIDPKETFWSLTTHFIADIFHYDGKVIKTVRYLLFKPGYLTEQYMLGKRATFLHPIRLYVFVSAIFFLVFFSFFVSHSEHEKKAETKTYQSIYKELTDRKKELDELKNNKKALTKVVGEFPLDTIIQRTQVALDMLKTDTSKLDEAEGYAEYGANWRLAKLWENRTKEQYLDSQQKLPTAQRDGFLKRRAEFLEISFKKNAKESNYTTSEYAKNLIVHNLPKALFLCLPLFALMLRLLYVRRAKQFNYVSHVVFSIHLFCYFFISSLIYFVIDALFEYCKINDWGILTILCFVWYI